MEYIAISLLAILAITLVIYYLANKVFGVSLRLKSLVLCAACAMFLSMVLPRIVVSFAGLGGTVGLLAFFAVLFAYFVAYYDDPDQTDCTEQTAKPFKLAADALAAAPAAQFTEHVPVYIKAPAKAPDATDKAAGEAAATAVVSPDSRDEGGAALLTEDSLAPAGPLIAEAAPDNSGPDSDKLEDLLDYAFSQKENGKYNLALDAFRRAFTLYRDSEAACLIAGQIATLLKSKGAYDEAIAILLECRNVPLVSGNEALGQEFVNAIAYLRIIKNILLRNQLGFMPYDSIPADIAKEIDAEFKEWRNMA